MKYFSYILLLAISIFAINWVFNHVNPWAAIGLIIVAVFVLINFITKQLKKQDK